MTARTMIGLSTALALGLASLSVAAPAQARNGWDHGRYDQRYDRGDRYQGYNRAGYRGDYRDYRGGYRGGYGYRCRGSDGTAGTIIGAIAGGLLGHEVVGRRGDQTAGTIVGGAVGAVAGRAIDKSDDRCR